MILKRASKLLLAVVFGVFALGASFATGYIMGEAERFQVSLEINATGDAAGRMAAYESGWNTSEVAMAICGTRNMEREITYQHSSFARTPFEFSCGVPEKDTQ